VGFGPLFLTWTIQGRVLGLKVIHWKASESRESLSDEGAVQALASRTKKISKVVSEDSRCPHWHSNPSPARYSLEHYGYINRDVTAHGEKCDTPIRLPAGLYHLSDDESEWSWHSSEEIRGRIHGLGRPESHETVQYYICHTNNALPGSRPLNKSRDAEYRVWTINEICCQLGSYHFWGLMKHCQILILQFCFPGKHIARVGSWQSRGDCRDSKLKMDKIVSFRFLAIHWHTYAYFNSVSYCWVKIAN
jgi:hypothetical protein